MPNVLHDEFYKLKNDSIELVNKAKAESRELTTEERANQEKRFTRMDVIKQSTIDEQKAASYELEKNEALEQFARAAHEPQAKMAIDRQFSQSAGETYAQFNGVDYDRQMYKAACREASNWIRGEHQQYTLITTSGTSAFLPTKVLTPLAVRRLPNAILAGILSRGLQPLYTADTASYSLPVFDDSSNDAITETEGNTTAENADPTISANPITLGATLFDTKALWFSNTLLLAPGFDLIAYSEPHLDKRIDHKQQSTWTAKALATSGINNYGGSSATGVTFADVLGWYHKQPVAYRSDIVFNVADTLMQSIRGIVDTYGRPIYIESLAADMPDKLLGQPVFVNDALATLTASAISGLAFSAECAVVRLCTNRRLARYVNVPATTNIPSDSFGLEMFVNGDAGFLGTGVTTYTMHS
jgi:HK97 family phage major capsid protein